MKTSKATREHENMGSDRHENFFWNRNKFSKMSKFLEVPEL